MATNKDDVTKQEWPSEGGSYHRTPSGVLKQDEKATKEAPLIPEPIKEPAAPAKKGGK